MKKLLQIGILAITAIITACAESPQVSQEIPWQQVKAGIPAGKALVYVVRPFSNAAAGNQYSIKINGRHVIDMRTGTYFSYLVPSGEVHISAETVPHLQPGSCFSIHG